jgi:DNA repair exonuclease SbcCD nuclease subunit
MTRIAFVADLHADDLGSKVNPESGLNARFEDALEVLRWVAFDAAKRKCDVLVVGGDFTEQRHPAPWRVAMIADALGEFHSGGYVLVRGNHDGLRAGRSIVDVLGDMLPGAHGFSRPGIAWVGRTAICALPYLDRHFLRSQPGFESLPDADVYRALGEQFLALARGLYAQAHAEHPDLEATVLVVHQGLAGGQMSEAQQAFLGDLALIVDTAAIEAIGFDAVLAGHFHRRQVLSEQPLVLYAGSPHRVSFQEENEVKSYVVLDLDVDGTTGKTVPVWQEVETPARRFVTLQWNDQLAEPEDVKGAIVRVLDVPPTADIADIRRRLEGLGAFEVAEVRVARAEAPTLSRSFGEATSPIDALAAYFEGDPDAAALVERGGHVLAEVAA